MSNHSTAFRLLLAGLLLGSGLAIAHLRAAPQVGRAPDVRLLVSELHPGISTKADVLRVLGAPRGYGRTELASMDGPRVTWFYERTDDARTDRERVMILLVHFKGEVFDGYLWFSSLHREAQGTAP